jgi:hypothetical protein
MKKVPRSWKSYRFLKAVMNVLYRLAENQKFPRIHKNQTALMRRLPWNRSRGEKTGMNDSEWSGVEPAGMTASKGTACSPEVTNRSAWHWRCSSVTASPFTTCMVCTRVYGPVCVSDPCISMPLWHGSSHTALCSRVRSAPVLINLKLQQKLCTKVHHIICSLCRSTHVESNKIRFSILRFFCDLLCFLKIRLL